MSYDSSKHVYHLTPKGWICTYSQYLGHVDQDDPIPKDRVESWTRTMEQASGWSREHVSWTRTWASKKVPAVKRRALRERFPHPGDTPFSKIEDQD
jgi:hypothetical protein